jgi:hypothetical protein
VGTYVTGSGTKRAVNTYVANVKDYGALGDGTTDDTAAFINALAVNKQVSVPCGTYKISSSIILPLYTTLQGSGECTVLKASANFDVVLPNWGTTLSDLTIDCSAVVGYSSSAVYFNGTLYAYTVHDYDRATRLNSVTINGQGLTTGYGLRAYCGNSSSDLCKVFWVVGTGVRIVQFGTCLELYGGTGIGFVNGFSFFGLTIDVTTNGIHFFNVDGNYFTGSQLQPLSIATPNYLVHIDGRSSNNYLAGEGWDWVYGTSPPAVVFDATSYNNHVYLYPLNAYNGIQDNVVYTSTSASLNDYPKGNFIFNSVRTPTLIGGTGYVNVLNALSSLAGFSFGAGGNVSTYGPVSSAVTPTGGFVSSGNAVCSSGDHCATGTYFAKQYCVSNNATPSAFSGCFITQGADQIGVTRSLRVAANLAVGNIITQNNLQVIDTLLAGSGISVTGSGNSRTISSSASSYTFTGTANQVCISGTSNAPIFGYCPTNTFPGDVNIPTGTMYAAAARATVFQTHQIVSGGGVPTINNAVGSIPTCGATGSPGSYSVRGTDTDFQLTITTGGNACGTGLLFTYIANRACDENVICSIDAVGNNVATCNACGSVISNIAPNAEASATDSQTFYTYAALSPGTPYIFAIHCGCYSTLFVDSWKTPPKEKPVESSFFSWLYNLF